MKILNVRIKNLNSLEGDWFIDFSDPAYTNSGIFAITGPTGAGKTTILDAICLALYGVTPRLNSVSQSTNEIMSRGTADCSAEVLFETQKGRFRCTWQQHRARGRADGQLQAPKHELVHAETNAIITTKISEVKTEIEQLTGLDFDRFTRSMLLAQGRFAAFLQSGPNERAPILEQITGTEIYAEISIEVFRRSKEVDEELQRLKTESGGIEVLSPDQLSHFQSELTQLQIASDNGKIQAANLFAQIQWLEQIAHLKEAIRNEEQLQDTLTAEILAFEPSKRKLERDGAARRLDIPYSELHVVRREYEHADAEVHRIRDRLPNLEQVRNQVQQQHDRAVEWASQRRTQWNQQIPILQQVRALDSEVGQRREFLKKLLVEIEGYRSRMKNLAVEMGEHQQNLAAAISRRDQFHVYLSEHAQDAVLVEQFSGIESDICAWLGQSKDLSRKTDDRRELDQRIETAQMQIQKDRSDLELHQDELRAAEQALQSGDAALSELLQGRSVREFDRDREHLVEQKRLRSIIMSLESHRANLRAGEACPLCGATDHPFATGQLPSPDELDDEINRVGSLVRHANELADRNRYLSDAVQHAKSRFQAAEIKWTSSRSVAENLAEQSLQKEEEYRIAEQRLDTLRTALLAKITPFGFERIPDHEEEKVLDRLSQRRDDWLRNQTRYEESNSEVPSIQREIQSRQAAVAEIEVAVAHKLEEIRELEMAIDRQIAKRRELLDDKNPDDESNRMLKELEHCEKEVSSAREQLRTAHSDWTTANATLASVTERSASAKKQLEQLEPVFRASMLAIGFSDEGELIRARLEEGTRQEWTETQLGLANRQYNLAQSLAEKRRMLRSESDRNLTARESDELKSALSELEISNERSQRRIGEIQAILSKNSENLTRVSERAQQIAKQEIECERWGCLNELIGSADGKKYRNFVQALTFERLIHFSNEQLSNMTDRYLLIADKGSSMSLNVIDNYHAGETRTTKNLSGGESFIVSLALALGLSRMASQRVRVDSLFLDEGFGTLDEDALDVALDTLSRLHQEGKLIGVISHVPALKERISTKIQVVPRGSGRSILRGPGCSRKPNGPV